MPSYWQETPSCYNLSHPSLSCRTSLCSFLQCQGLAELHLMWFVQALIMHLQDARCMNSSSNKSAGRLLHRIVLLSWGGRGKRTARAHTHPHRLSDLGGGASCCYEGVTASSRRGQAEDHEYCRRHSCSWKVLTCHPRKPCGKTWGVWRLTHFRGLASGAWALPHCQVPITVPKHPKNKSALPPSAPHVPPSGQRVSGAQKREDIIYLPHVVWKGDFTLRTTAQAVLPTPRDGERPWWLLYIGAPLSAFLMRGLQWPPTPPPSKIKKKK